MENKTEEYLLSILMKFSLKLEHFEKIDSFFENKDNDYIYKILKEMYNKSINIDLLSLTNFLIEKKFLNISKINEIYDLDVFESNFNLYFNKMKIYNIKKNIKKVVNESSDELFFDDLENCIYNNYSQIKIYNNKEICKDFNKKKEEAFYDLGVSWFLKWRKGFGEEFIIIGARPNIGKTSYAIQFFAIAIEKNYNPIFFSLENSQRKIMSKLLANLTGIEEFLIWQKRLKKEEREIIDAKLIELYDKNYYIVDQAGISLNQLKRKIKEAQYKYKSKIIIIDYLQLIKVNNISKNKPRHEQLEEISNELKNLQRELKICLIALCQVNRENSKENREPKLSDLKGSGSMEQDADIVILLHNETEYKENEEKNLIFDEIKHIVGKDRNAPTGFYRTKYYKYICRFREYSKI